MMREDNLIIEDSSSQKSEEKISNLVTPSGNSSELDAIRRLFIEIIKDHQRKSSCKSNSINFLILVVGFSAGVPYISPAKQFARDNHILGYIYAGSEVLALGTLTSWLLKDIFNYVKYKKMITLRINCRSASFILIPLSLALFTALPSTVIGYIYNEKAPYLAGIAFLGDIISNTFTFNNLLNTLSKKISSKTSRDIRYFATRKKILANLRTSKIDIANLSDIEFQEFIESINFSSVTNESHPDTTILINFIKGIVLFKNLNRTSLNNRAIFLTKEIISLLMAIVMPMNWAPTAYKLVFTSANKIIGISSISEIIAVFSSAPIYLLEGLFNRRMFMSLFNLFHNLSLGNSVKNFSFYHYPKIFISMIIAGLLIAGLSFSTRALVIEETYADGFYKNISLPWVSIMICLYKAYAILNCIPNFIEFFSSFSSNKTIVNKVNFLQLIDRFISLFEELNCEQLGEIVDAFQVDFESRDITTEISLDEVRESPARNRSSLFFSEHKSEDDLYIDESSALVENSRRSWCVIC